MNKSIALEVRYTDALYYKADVLILKHAQIKYGIDKIISADLYKGGVANEQMCPKAWHATLLNNAGTTGYEKILFVGTPGLEDLGYSEINKFTRQALAALRWVYPDTMHIAMTIHGIEYGLDA